MAESMSETAPRRGLNPNVTDETRQQAYREAMTAKRAADSAQGVYRATLKKWKAAGVPIKVVTEALKLRDADPDEVQGDLRELIHMLALTSIPTIQQDLFGDLVEPSVTEKSAREMELARAKDDGHFAGAGSEPRTSNKHISGTELYVMWDEGWLEGERELQKRAAILGENAKKGAGGGTTTTRKKAAAPKKAAGKKAAPKKKAAGTRKKAAANGTGDRMQHGPNATQAESTASDDEPGGPDPAF